MSALSPFFKITIASRVGNDLYYLLADPTGQAVVVADETGQEAGHILYDPLGEVIAATLPPALAETLAGSLDPDTGLQYHGVRFYQPYLNRFINPDTIVPNPVSLQNFNRSSYGQDNLDRHCLAISGPVGCHRRK